MIIKCVQHNAIAMSLYSTRISLRSFELWHETPHHHEKIVTSIMVSSVEPIYI